MKNSEFYAKKIKRLLSRSGVRVPEGDCTDAVALLVRSVFEENATAKQAEKALAALKEEFVDFNELRVSPIKDIVECVGRDYPGARAKAVAVTTALNRIFDQVNALQLDYLAKKPKREIRKSLREDLGLSPYAESCLTLLAFGGHAVPVDNLLLEALKLEGCIHPDSDEPDLQGFLERIIRSAEAKKAHWALRAYAARRAGRVARLWARREREARAAEAKAREEQARAEAEAKARAEAEAKAKAEAEAEAKRRAAAKKSKKARPKKAKTRKAKKKATKRVVKARAKSGSRPAKGRARPVRRTAKKAARSGSKKR